MAAAAFLAHPSVPVSRPGVFAFPFFPSYRRLPAACCLRLPVVFSFSPQVDAVLSELKSAASASRRLHICLFSATLPPSVVLLAESIAYGAVHLTVGGLQAQYLHLVSLGFPREGHIPLCHAAQAGRSCKLLLLLPLRRRLQLGAVASGGTVFIEDHACGASVACLLLTGAGRASAAAPQIEQELLFCSTEAGKLWALKTLRLERRLIPPCLIFVEARLETCCTDLIGDHMCL